MEQRTPLPPADSNTDKPRTLAARGLFVTAADAFGLRKEASDPRRESTQVQGSSEEPNQYEPQRLENVDMSARPHCKHTAEIVWLGIFIDCLSI